MAWTQLSKLILTPDWQLTPVTKGCYFRFKHSNLPIQPVGWLAQAEIDIDKSIQIFEPSFNLGRALIEIKELKCPAVFSNRCLAFRQDTKTKNNWTVIIEASNIMASYSLDDPAPTNQSASSTKTPFSVPVGATPTKILPANPLRKGVLFISNDKFKTVYLDTDNIVSSTSAIESVTPSKPQCIPNVNWTGEWWGVTSSGSVTITGEEYT